MVEYPITHVVDALPQYRGPLAGQSQATDAEIAQWCGQTEHVLVTIDTDFSGRWVRSGLLAVHGVEVIVFDRDIPGLRNQHARITRHFDAWQDALRRQPYLHRVWIQGKRIEPVLNAGSSTRRRIRAQNATR